MNVHVHEFLEFDRHENDDRTRTAERCSCGAERYGCCAKRLDAEGREAWGPPGKWGFHVVEAGL